MSDKTGGPAFPVADVIPSGMGGIVDLRRENKPTSGMALWDYFAAHAPKVSPDRIVQAKPGQREEALDAVIEFQKIVSARFADAMIAEREKRGIK